MPKRRNPELLRTQCVAFVSKNFARVICCAFRIEGTFLTLDDLTKTENGKRLAKLISSPEFHSVNPFEAIPSNVLYDIVSHQGTWLSHTLAFLPFIVTVHSEKIYVFPQARETLKTLFESEPAWHARSLVWEDRVPPTTSILSKLTNLKEIHGILNDVALRLLGKHCPLLECVHVTCSTGFSDKGLASLTPLRHLKIVILGHGELAYNKKSPVTAKGIKQLLDRASSVEVLGYLSLVEMLAKIHWDVTSKKSSENQPPVYNIRELRYGLYENELALDPCIGRPFPRALKLCPKVVQIVMRNANELHDEDFQALLLLEKLESLHVDGSRGRKRNSTVNFCDHLLPVLKLHGPHLKHLALQAVKAVNIELLVFLCPALDRLNLFGCEFTNDWDLSISKPSEPVRSTNLETLRVVENNNEVPAHHWPCILSSAYLREIKIFGSSTLSDQIIHRVMKSNLFPMLNILSLGYLPHVTSASLLKFLHLDNQLCKIEYDHPDWNVLLSPEFVQVKEYCTIFDVVLNC